MKLYFAPNTISIASVIALHEAGIAFDPVRVDFASGEQTTPAYHAINPKGRVPALVTEEGILTETGAILEFIAQSASDARLVPDDPWQAAQMRSAMFYLASTMHVNHAHKMRGHRWSDDEAAHKSMTAKVPQTMRDSCAFVEENVLTRGPFVMGEAFTIADPYLYVVCSWLEGDGVTVSDFPNITAFRAAMQARASVQKVHEEGMLT